ncbi:unnamed protein product [Arctia plantaginis]|uniref:Cytochrome b5-related protein n=1 Tax=Arctia plantaginis TaxID=874455 RepID=A0A8S0ZW52_ARCPL|nr:unnamed protein product [Arctia plantaginis]
MSSNSEWSEIAQRRVVAKSTHASFPQLKYPSLRDAGLKDPVQWLAGKSMDDGAEGLWRVHDKLYDLTKFIKLHPGGEEWLELTKGTDITEAFESHHLNPAAEKILTQYYIKDAKTPRNSPFTFKEDGFYKTLKKVVFEELKKIPKDGTKTTDRITDDRSSNHSKTGLQAVVHSADSTKPSGTFKTSRAQSWSRKRDFRISHVLSHHLYTNTLLDLDITELEPFLLLHPRKDKPFYAKLGPIIELFFFPFYFLISFSKRIICIFLRKGFFKKHFRWHDALGLTLPIFMWITTGTPVLQVISTWLSINCIGSFIFTSIAVSASHHHPDVIKDGDQPRSETPDWGMHQIEALLDRKDVNNNVFAVIILFGDHALHHMFPTLDHGILRHLRPIFIEICEKFQANYQVSTQFQLVLGQIKETMRTEFKTIKQRYT